MGVNDSAPKTWGGGELSIPFDIMVGLGKVKDWSMVLKFGRNATVSTTEEDVWIAGGTIVHPTSAYVASVVSGSGDDDLVGTGAQTVTVWGLDTNYLEVSETVDTDGATPVTTTQTFRRINTAKVITAGSGEKNAGNITVSLNSNVQATIEAGEGLNHDSHYTVPAGHTAYLLDATTFQGKDNDAQVGFFCKGLGGTWISPGNFLCFRSQVHVDVIGFPMAEKGDIKMVAKNLGASTVDQAVFYRLLLGRNEDS